MGVLVQTQKLFKIEFRKSQCPGSWHSNGKYFCLAMNSHIYLQNKTIIIHFELNVFNHFTKNSLLYSVFTFISGTENKLRSNTVENKLEILVLVFLEMGGKKRF